MPMPLPSPKPPDVSITRAGLASFDKAPAFFAEFLRGRYSAPPPRHRLPLVLTNRSVLGSGESLQHLAHPFLPLAILGYSNAL